MRQVRVAVIGAGGIGATHLRAYAAWPELCTVAGVADIDRTTAEATAAPYGTVPLFTDPIELLDALQPDAVSICTPPREHLPLARAAAQRGIACLCEKPPARTVAEAEAIVSAFAESGALLQFAFCHRFHQPLRQVQTLIAEGKLGKVIQIYNRFGFRFDRAATSWFTDAELSGGGVLIDTLVHSLDIFRVLAGEIVRVDAAVSTTLPVDVEDSASIQVVSASGVIGSLNCSWVTPVSEAEIRVWGSEGEAVIDYAVSDGARYRLAGQEAWTVLPFEGPDRFVLQAEHFLTCVRSGRQPAVGAADGIAVMRAIESAYRSTASQPRGDKA